MNNISSVTSMDLGGHFQGSLLGMVLNAGLMVQFVLLLLLVFSIVSWAIIFLKYKGFKKIVAENKAFLGAYMGSSKLSDLLPQAKKFENSSLAEVFRSGYGELTKLTKVLRDSASSRDNADYASSLEIRGIDNVERALHRACDAEASKMEAALGFLATTGSASPFIGLFGTVWGIMDTFKGIGAKGAATLAVVAPGISESLIATAAGLAAAIPAVIFYNYYVNRVKAMNLEMDNFASEFLNIVERHQANK
ncbi:MAG: protein TolQ [Smithellaceae bacterium]|nr:protein TolQ [Smithellaceae bacterium]